MDPEVSETTSESATENGTTAPAAPPENDTSTEAADPRFAETEEDNAPEADQDLSPEELRSKYLGARRGMSKAAEELKAERARLAALEAQNQQMLEAFRNPDFIETLREHYRKQNGAAEPLTAEKIAEEVGFSADTIQSLEKYMARMGYVRKTDPEVQEPIRKLNTLYQDRESDTWKGLVAKYPGAAEHRGKIAEIAQRVGDSMSLEQIYVGLSGGQAAVEKVRQELRTDVAKRKEAMLPRAGAPGVTQKKAEKFDDFMGAFKAAMKEQGISSLKDIKRR